MWSKSLWFATGGAVLWAFGLWVHLYALAGVGMWAMIVVLVVWGVRKVRAALKLRRAAYEAIVEDHVRARRGA